MPHCRTFGLVLAFVVSFSAHAAGEGIRWEVHNRFPLLKPKHFDRIKEQWKRLPPGEQTMWHFIRARMEEKGLGSGMREFLLAPPPDSSSATRAAADGLRTPEVAVLLGVEGSNCQWVIEPAPAGAPEQGQCNTTMIVPVDTPFKVTAKRASMQDAVVEVRVREIVIVAMGDSYASGEGSPDRPAIYPTKAKTPLANEWFMRGLREDEGSVESAIWWDPVCHRSLLSWPVLASLRVALQNTQAVVHIVNVACSGAEFFDGFVWSQKKAKFQQKRQGSALTLHRDGLGRRAVPAGGGHYLQRSQLNAVRDVLCKPLNDGLVEQIDVDLHDRAFQASMRPCSFIRRPDALLLTAGGNDTQFAAAVTGVFLPSVARTPIIGSLGLAITRSAVGAISPKQLAINAKNWRANYGSYLEAVQRAVGVDADRTVLLGYPNPVGTAQDSCTTDIERARVRNAFMTLGPAARVMAPAIARPFIRGWTIEIDQDELKVFSEEAYPAVVAMQDLVRDRVVQWHPKPKADAEALNDRSFSDRLLCKSAEAATEKQLQLEPIFFCSRSEAGPDECAVYESGNQLRIEPSFQRREQLSQWRFEAPGRRMTNSTNDALLAQRTWDKNAPSMEELSYAIAGAMHPTTESHAVGADSAYERLAKMLMENLRVPVE